MHFDKFAFGSIEIDGSTYEHDVVIDRGEINKRQEKTLQEIPRGVRSYAAVRRGKDTLEMSAPRGRNRRARRASVMGEVRQEAQRRKVELLVLPTAEAIKALQQGAKDTNAVLHVAC